MTTEVKAVTKEETAYDKWIHFTYEGEDYHAHLHWDKFDGYDLNFTDSTRSANWVETPDWAILWEDENGESLELTLDNLTDETLEEK